MENLVDCLEHWTDKQPGAVLFNFLDGKGNSREQYTYRQFHERTLGLSKQLADQAELDCGDRALLVYPPGLEMMAGFFACLNIGVIPVPVSAPMTTASKAAIGRVEHVARDCGARVVLTTSGYLRSISGPAGATRFLNSLRWLATDAMMKPGTPNGRRKSNPILFLQYTSGSTGDPKGVMVTHRNVMHNAHATLQHCPLGVSWLPQYHDMGLIGHYLFMVVLGGTNHGFSPFDFLRRPVFWLQLISRVRATVTTAPNFAYSYCLREDKVPDDALHDIDLSSLKMMSTAAEPVDAETYARFFDRFKRYRLPRESYQAGYGLAENTLGVSRNGRRTLTVQKQRMQQRRLCVHKNAVRNNNHLSLVSCGPPMSGLDVRIVDPDTRLDLGDNAIGEIWIAGESKCAGYWQRPELTQSVFHARIADDPSSERTFLRTGDLGFFHEGELFVCGRLKDMIIVRGSNYYPHDIEAIVASEFPEIGPGGPVQSAAFSVEHEGEERLIVAVEARPSQDLVDPGRVAQAIWSRYFIDPYQVLFVPPRAIAKTTSGKVARSETRDRWLRGVLPVLASYIQPDGSQGNTGGLREAFERIRELYRLRGDEEVTLIDVGLDSLTLVDLTLELQAYFERRGLADIVSEVDARFLQRLTVAELARLLDAYESNPDAPTEDLRVWLGARQQADDAREIELMRADAQWQPPSAHAEEAVDDPKSILMTGASGFFGPFLLASLLQRTACAVDVLVRAADSGHGRARILEALRRAELLTPEMEDRFHARVRFTCGDLGHPRLGLDDREWQRLAADIDAVVHNGAVVNYVLSYDALRSYNIGGTRELMRLAATHRKKPFHLVSSTFVHGWSARPVAAEHEYNAELEELDFGYSQSKCIQEHLVLDAERHGHPVRIYRPTLITASAHGVGSRDDIGVRLLAFMIKYGIAVEALNQVSFLPVHVVSDHIARIFALKDPPSSTYHVTTTTYYNMIDVTRSITEQFGYSFKYYDMPGFIEEMNKLCTPDDLLYPLLVFFNRTHHKFKPMEPKRYDNRHYRAALDRVKPDIVEPRMEDTVAYIIKHMRREGLIPGPDRAKSPASWSIAPSRGIAQSG